MKPKNLVFIITLTFNLFLMYGQNAVNGFDAQGNRHGAWVKYYEGTKNIRYKGQFEHGKETGIFTHYINNARHTVAATRDFTRSADYALVTYFASNGSIISQGKMKGKKRSGEWKIFHKNSEQVMHIENYKGGALDGSFKTFFDTGQLFEHYNYADGKRQGAATTYFSNGKKSGTFQYKDDKLHGEVAYFDVEGHMTSSGSYKDDKRVGIWKFYEEGKQVDSVDYSPVKNPKYRKN